MTDIPEYAFMFIKHSEENAHLSDNQLIEITRGDYEMVQFSFGVVRPEIDHENQEIHWRYGIDYVNVPSVLEEEDFHLIASDILQHFIKHGTQEKPKEDTHA